MVLPSRPAKLQNIEPDGGFLYVQKGLKSWLRTQDLEAALAVRLCLWGLILVWQTAWAVHAAPRR